RTQTLELIEPRADGPRHARALLADRSRLRGAACFARSRAADPYGRHAPAGGSYRAAVTGGGSTQAEGGGRRARCRKGLCQAVFAEGKGRRRVSPASQQLGSGDSFITHFGRQAPHGANGFRAE